MPRIELAGGMWHEWDPATMPPHPATGPGVSFIEGASMAAKAQPAPANGIQIWNGVRYRAVRGEMMYPGARFVSAEEDAAETTALLAKRADEAAAKLGGRQWDPKGGAVVESGPTSNQKGKGPKETSDATGGGAS